jgi:hypothetical protein
MESMFEAWGKNFNLMENPKNKTLAELRREAFEAGFNACAKQYEIEEEKQRWHK